MANPSPSIPAVADVQITAPNNPELQNQTPPNTAGDCKCMLCIIFGTHSDPMPIPSTYTPAPHHDYIPYTQRYTKAERDKHVQEYLLRRRLTGMSYLDSPMTSTPPSVSSPRRYRPLTDAERRKEREYAEEYARFIGPNYWKLPPVDSVQDDADVDENTEQRSEG